MVVVVVVTGSFNMFVFFGGVFLDDSIDNGSLFFSVVVSFFSLDVDLFSNDLLSGLGGNFLLLLFNFLYLLLFSFEDLLLFDGLFSFLDFSFNLVFSFFNLRGSVRFLSFFVDDFNFVD